MKKALLARLKSGGFTMIELLIVIAILGILAVMVLAAINPLEQINRGRDTAKRGDAEQLLGAFERYNAFNGYFPWMYDQNDANIAVGNATAAQSVTALWMSNLHPTTNVSCPILERLGNAVSAGCVGTQELKVSFTDRVDDYSGVRGLWVYYRGLTGDNVYVCFSPQSEAFKNEASTRCGNSTGDNLPDDLGDVAGLICDIANANMAGETGVPMICLP